MDKTIKRVISGIAIYIFIGLVYNILITAVLYLDHPQNESFLSVISSGLVHPVFWKVALFWPFGLLMTLSSLF